MKILQKQDLWNKIKVSTRGTVILSWLILICVSVTVLLGQNVPEIFVTEAFYFTLFVMLFSTCGLNGIEAWQSKKKNSGKNL